jgi:hypothetical protein
MITEKPFSYAGELKLALKHLWRPLLTFAHILFVVLIVLGTWADQPLYFQEQQGQLSKTTPCASSLLNCHKNSLPACCRPNVLRNLDRLYRELERSPMDLFFINPIIVICTMSATMCIVGCLTELALLRRIDANYRGHQVINKICTVAYIFSLLFLCRGIMGLELPEKEKFICSRHQDIPHEAKVINFCYRSMGLCRSTDTLMLVLISMVLYPVLCISSLCCGGACAVLWWSRADKKAALRELKSRSSPPALTHAQSPKPYKPAEGGLVPIHSPVAQVTAQAHAQVQSRAQLHTLLHFLERDPSVRHDEHYLTMLARSFKSYVRNGNTPRITNPANVPISTPRSENPEAPGTGLTTPPPSYEEIQGGIKPAPSPSSKANEV